MPVGSGARRTRKSATAPARSPTTPDPIEMAMEAEAHDTAADSPARRVLVEQLELIRTQTKLGRRQIASESLGLALKIGLGFLGLVVAIVLGVMVWTASRADGLVIQPFSVPPALAQRGVTGEAIAAQIMDRIGTMVEISSSSETQRQVAASRNDVSIQIPETGISISQLEQWLRQKLGHERRVTGELMTAPDGSLVLAARAGSVPLTEQRGAEAELPTILQRMAEDLYGREQPASYSGFLSRSGRTEDSRTWLTGRTTSPDQQVRARAYAGLASEALTTDLMEVSRLQEKGLAIDPRASSSLLNNLTNTESNLGHAERALQLIRRSIATTRDPKAYSNLSAEVRPQYILNDQGIEANMLGDFTRTLAIQQAFSRGDLRGFAPAVAPAMSIADALGNLHDVNRARQVLSTFDPQNEPQRVRKIRTAMSIETAAQNWPEAWSDWQEGVKSWESRSDKGAYYYAPRALGVRVLIGLGRLDDAQALVDQTPLDCAPCITVRGELAAARGQTAIADHWFSEGARMAPSIPLPAQRWGLALLARRDYAGAIARFQDASRRGPHWADPLEGWGEALLAQGRAKESVEKFEAAAKYAPNWGRLHLYWGQALARAGKPREAMAEYNKAAALFLTPTERVELARVQGAH